MSDETVGAEQVTDEQWVKSEQKSDLCECGDYRSQHDNERCKICSCTCKGFRFAREATSEEHAHWKKWNDYLEQVASEIAINATDNYAAAENRTHDAEAEAQRLRVELAKDDDRPTPARDALVAVSRVYVASCDLPMVATAALTPGRDGDA